MLSDTKSELVRDCYYTISNKLAEIYLISTPDVRKCPKLGCNGAGIISFQPCTELNECLECGFKWKDPIQMTAYERFKENFVKSFNFKNDVKTNLRKILVGEPCPNCGIIIDKNEGCTHMVC